MHSYAVRTKNNQQVSFCVLLSSSKLNRFCSCCSGSSGITNIFNSCSLIPPVSLSLSLSLSVSLSSSHATSDNNGRSFFVLPENELLNIYFERIECRRNKTLLIRVDQWTLLVILVPLTYHLIAGIPASAAGQNIKHLRVPFMTFDYA